ncbi:MAG TPA: transporter [Terriglobia bacterium]
MRSWFKLVSSIAVALGSLQALSAQELAPRAYIITPLHSNAVTLTYGFYDGSLLFNGALPISNATGKYSVPTLSYYHSFKMFGHSANVVATLPYAVGHFEGNLAGVPTQLYRSGLADSTFRLAMNLKGGPAMEAPEFRKWKQKTIIGVSLKVLAPTGQYDPHKLVNWGANRWAFKPELGYSERWGKVVFDAYGGAWFYTTNPQYYTGHNEQSQQPIGALESHLSYDFRGRTWVSLDGNFWFGGVTSLNGIADLKTRQTSSRIGATGSIRLDKHQSLKFSYSDGEYVRFGGNYQSVSVAWQYSWIGHPGW